MTYAKGNDHWTWRGVAVLVGGAYVALMVVVVWSPMPLTGPLEPLLVNLESFFHTRLGAPPGFGWRALEFAANVVFFVPPALLVTFGMRRPRINVVLGFVAAVTIEFVQYAALPGRSSTLSDVVANTLGALIGALVGAALHPSRTQSRSAPKAR